MQLSLNTFVKAAAFLALIVAIKASKQSDLNAAADEAIQRIRDSKIFRDSYFGTFVETDFVRQIGAGTVAGKVNFLNLIFSGFKANLGRSGDVKIDEQEDTKAVLTLQVEKMDFSAKSRVSMLGASKSYMVHGKVAAIKFELELFAAKGTGDLTVAPLYVQGFNNLDFKVIDEVDPGMAETMKHSAFEGFNRFLRDKKANPMIAALVKEIKGWKKVAQRLAA